MAKQERVNGSETMEDALRDIRGILARIAESLESIAAGMNQAPPRKSPDEDLSDLTTEDLSQRLERAKERNDPYGLLDLRLRLKESLDHSARVELDRELAGWMTEFFQRALRAGRAVHVAGAIERAVNEIGEIPEMDLLADALPVIMRSVGLKPMNWEEER